MNNRGSYVLVLKLEKDKKIKVGSLGYIQFKKGYYLYAGSGKKNLYQRIEMHKKKNKKLFWHIDYLRKESKFVSVVVFRELSECEIGKKLKEKTDGFIKNFGCSDCRCKSHLFFSKNINYIKTL